MYLSFAYLQHNATALGINHAPLPKDAERRLVWMINARITDPQFKAHATPPATSLSDDTDMETAPADTSLLSDRKRQACPACGQGGVERHHRLTGRSMILLSLIN